MTLFVFQARVCTVFTKNIKCSKDMQACPEKKRPSPRNGSLLLKGTLSNRFWRPSTQPSFVLPTLVTGVTAKGGRKSDPYTSAPSCLSSHCSSFYSLEGSLHSSGKLLAPLTGSRQSLYCLNYPLPRRTDHP